MKRPGLIALTVLLFTTAALRDAVDDWIDATQLPLTLAETSTEIRDRSGTLLRAYTVGNGIWRLAPQLDKVDAGYLRMLVRFEDKRFWNHSGVDLLAMLRAGAQAVWHGRAVSGGSTLTMQVARLVEDGSTGKWAGKLRQIRLALALERQLSKRQILTLYLTHAPYGGNLEGIRAASLAWFGKEPQRLTQGQAALLVALPQSPESRRPDRHPTAARAARNRVLARTAQREILPQNADETAARSPLPDRMRPFPRLAPHLADRVRTAALDQLKIDLTLQAPVQTVLQELVGDAARQAGSRVSAALVAANHRTGEIIASVGSPAYDADQGRQGYVDMTQAIRSPGSTLKPLIYGLAMDQGLVHPDTLIHDGPVRFGRYAPRNFDGQFRGDIRIRDALQQSLNIPVVKLTHELGPARVMAALDRSGAQAALPGGAPGLAIALGGVGISLQDLVQLYAGLAQGGQGPLLHVRKDAPPQSGQRMMSDVAAWQVSNILSGLTPPPGAPAEVLAYKTGTSYGHRDAWAIGYDGQHVIGVWMGRADGTPVPGAFGADLAAPLLFEAFGRLKHGFDPLSPPPPATLIPGSAALPQPLQRFRSRNAHFTQSEDAPALLYPPDGAQFDLAGGPVTMKLRGGVGPYLVLANGRPLVSEQYNTEFDIPNPGAGFSTLVVVDRKGRSDRVTIRLN